MISGNICVKFLSISDLRISSNKTDINTQESEQYNSTGTPEHIKVSKILCLMFAWRWEKLLKCCCICQVSVFWWYQLKVNRQRSKNCWTISTTSLCVVRSCHHVLTDKSSIVHLHYQTRRSTISTTTQEIFASIL